ncbi:MAG: hypothetical protein RM368_33880 [Nostoc sp. DedSLP03]|uniref:hypothetical protein n=1 Tax=Nostoc sp. DedSLP03 TaxID=3075400 RepID=UPI002AD4FEA7|nr:hypothetical protein [Nostoc sp. DedSLP03]MDZ7969873.1 hypothetical protein [Nostoc sp. DedSLP03]
MLSLQVLPALENFQAHQAFGFQYILFWIADGIAILLLLNWRVNSEVDLEYSPES